MESLIKRLESMSLTNKPSHSKRNTRKRGFSMHNVRGLSRRRSLTASQKARLRITKPSVAKALRNARSER
jgi:hypothetical protein